MFLISLLGGLGHILTSLIFGIIGIVLGYALWNLERIENWRGEIMGWLVIAFGIIYALWGLKHITRYPDPKCRDESDITPWVWIAIIVFGPCEPFIPLLFAAVPYGIPFLVTITIVFGTLTTGMVILMSLFGQRLLKLVWLKRSGDLVIRPPVSSLP